MEISVRSPMKIIRLLAMSSIHLSAKACQRYKGLEKQKKCDILKGEEKEVYCMRSFLIVVDMQKDFVDGSLGTKEAVAILPAVTEKIRSFEGEIFVTYDTHFEDYMDTAEGQKLPVEHCVKGTVGWELHEAVQKALEGKTYTAVEKVTFGSVDLPELIAEEAGCEEMEIELIGLCTDICVVSNALLLKANFPEETIKVDAACCAGVTPKAHAAALQVMQSCQIEVHS